MQHIKEVGLILALGRALSVMRFVTTAVIQVAGLINVLDIRHGCGIRGQNIMDTNTNMNTNTNMSTSTHTNTNMNINISPPTTNTNTSMNTSTSTNTKHHYRVISL